MKIKTSKALILSLVCFLIIGTAISHTSNNTNSELVETAMASSAQEAVSITNVINSEDMDDATMFILDDPNNNEEQLEIEEELETNLVKNKKALVKAAKKVQKASRKTSFTKSELKKLDVSKPSGLSASELEKANTYHGLDGLYDDFIAAEKKYDINAVFLMSISIVESGGAKHMFRTNNMFGYGNSGFSSKAKCIDTVAKALANKYLSSNGKYYNGKTVNGVNKIYCESSDWDSKVINQMYNIYKRVD